MKWQNSTLALLTMLLSNVTGAQDNCTPIELSGRRAFPIIAQDISQPGQYCLTHDIRAPRTYVFSEGGERSYPSFMLRVNTSDVDIDLHGFAMKVDTRGMGGVRLDYEFEENPFQRNIAIRNGTISTRGQSAIEFNNPEGSLLSDFKAMYKIPGSAESELQKLLMSLPQSADAYPETKFIVEHMRLEAQVGRAVVGMKGAGNVIRNSTIIAEDEHAGIYLFGPKNIIENNVIIYKRKNKTAPSIAPIKLHQADGTIIRNNDIIVESSGEDAPVAAISLIDSKDVVVEGNRIYGIKTLAHAWDEKSSLVDRDNDFRSMLRRPWATGEPGVH